MFCPEENCTSTFETAEDLSLHIARGEHQIPKIITSQDKAKNAFAKRMETTTKKANYDITAAVEAPKTENRCDIYLNLACKEGWALKPKRKKTRLNHNQKQFLQESFNKGKNRY